MVGKDQKKKRIPAKTNFENFSHFYFTTEQITIDFQKDSKNILNLEMMFQKNPQARNFLSF